MKEHIQGYCQFEYYKDSALWYRTEFTNLVFPVPIEDIGNATFSSQEKGLLLMRYIRKWLQALEG